MLKNIYGNLNTTDRIIKAVVQFVKLRLSSTNQDTAAIWNAYEAIDVKTWFDSLLEKEPLNLPSGLQDDDSEKWKNLQKWMYSRAAFGSAEDAVTLTVKQQLWQQFKYVKQAVEYQSEHKHVERYCLLHQMIAFLTDFKHSVPDLELYEHLFEMLTQTIERSENNNDEYSVEDFTTNTTKPTCANKANSSN